VLSGKAGVLQGWFDGMGGSKNGPLERSGTTMITKTERPLTQDEKASLTWCSKPRYSNAFFAG